jgi:serine/threonine protein kinase
MLVALLASASAPPVVIWVSLHAAKLQDLLPPWMFVVHHVLPYLICTAMAYLGARVVYNLGADVSRAHDLGSYRLIERLGQGGMGEVWRASHEFLARPAAIKFIRPEALGGADAEGANLLRRRFELEARSTASLTSAHTVEIYDFGVTDDGRFYYVMELLDGLDCDELVRRYGAGMPDVSDVRLTQPHQAIGTPQFTGESLYDVLSKHLRERPDPPSRHAPHALHPALDAVILACLEKEPDRRPGSARQLAQTLQSVPLDERWGDDEAEAWWDQAKLSHLSPAGAPS